MIWTLNTEHIHILKYVCYNSVAAPVANRKRMRMKTNSNCKTVVRQQRYKTKVLMSSYLIYVKYTIHNTQQTDIRQKNINENNFCMNNINFVYWRQKVELKKGTIIIILQLYRLSVPYLTVNNLCLSSQSFFFLKKKEKIMSKVHGKRTMRMKSWCSFVIPIDRIDASQYFKI